MDTLVSSMAGILTISNGTYNVVVPSVASKRLFWTLNGPLESAIQVAPSQYYEPGDHMETYFRPATADLTSSWHSVSQESLMEPQVPTITVRIRCLDDWEELWVELNRDYLDTKNDHRRPRAKHIQLEVTTTDAFVTVHDYVSAVHPWLMSMRAKILDALGNIEGRSQWPPEAKLAVLLFGRGPLSLGKVDRWAYWHRKPTRAVEMTWAEREEASEKVKGRMLARSAARIRDLERLRQENN